MSYFPSPSSRSPMSTPSSSPSTSLSGRTMQQQLATSPSGSEGLSELLHNSLTISTPHSSAQHYASALRKPSSGAATSYLSDADLFGDDQVAYMKEAPAPPRSAEEWQQQAARPLLPPVASIKPRTCSTASKTAKRRASSGASKVRSKG